MKRYPGVPALFSLFLLAFPCGLRSQARLYAGLKGGFCQSTHWSPREKEPDVSVETSAISGLTGGFILGIELNRIFSLESGCLYTEKGAHHVVTTPDFIWGPMDLDYQYTYLDIPVVLKTVFLSHGSLSFYSYGGAYVSFLNTNTYQFHNSVWGSSTHRIEKTNQTDWGLATGAGISLSTGRFRFHLEYRYAMGFHDIEFPTEPIKITELPTSVFPVIRLRNMANIFQLGWVVLL
jgi:hypothetical protein